MCTKKKIYSLWLLHCSAFGNGEARGDSPKDVTPPPSYRPPTPITTDSLLYYQRFGTDYTLPGYSEINSPRRQSQPLTVEQLYIVNEFGVLVPVQLPGAVGHFSLTQQPSQTVVVGIHTRIIVPIITIQSPYQKLFCS